MAKDGTGFTVLQSLQTNGFAGPHGVIEGSDGNLYGTTRFGGAFGYGTVFKVAKDGTGFTLLQSFEFGVGTNGALPYAGVIDGNDGNLYGTTTSGGVFDNGTLFKIAKDATGFTSLQSFEYGLSANGATPQAGVIEGSDGTLYGTTTYGGPFDDGTVFKIAKDGTGFTMLQSFQSDVSTNGAAPNAGVIEGSDGSLYGTTTSGGAYG